MLTSVIRKACARFPGSGLRAACPIRRMRRMRRMRRVNSKSLVTSRRIRKQMTPIFARPRQTLGFLLFWVKNVEKPIVFLGFLTFWPRFAPPLSPPEKCGTPRLARAALLHIKACAPKGKISPYSLIARLMEKTWKKSNPWRKGGESNKLYIKK